MYNVRVSEHRFLQSPKPKCMVEKPTEGASRLSLPMEKSGRPLEGLRRHHGPLQHRDQAAAHTIPRPPNIPEGSLVLQPSVRSRLIEGPALSSRILEFTKYCSRGAMMSYSSSGSMWRFALAVSGISSLGLTERSLLLAEWEGRKG